MTDFEPLNQFAFQKLHNTVACLLNVIDPWFKNSDEGKVNVSIFLELKKTFDTMTIKRYCRSYGSMLSRVLPTTGSLLT